MRNLRIMFDVTDVVDDVHGVVDDTARPGHRSRTSLPWLYKIHCASHCCMRLCSSF